MREFNTTLDVEEVKIDGVLHKIRELTADGRKVYLKALGDTMEVRMVDQGAKDDQGRPVMRREILMKDLSGAQEAILTNTMFRVNEDGTEKAITRDVVGSWPSKTVEELASMASELNGMETADGVLQERAEKN